MVYDAAKMGVKVASASYSLFKDIFLYAHKKSEYIKELESNLTDLTADMGTFYSKKEQIDRQLEREVSKEKNDEYKILVGLFKVFSEKYNKFVDKYKKHCQNLTSLPADSPAESRVNQRNQTIVHSPDVLTITSVIEALQKRKPTILTRKFLALAKLSRNIYKLRVRVLDINNRMTPEKVMVEKKVEVVQVKHDDLDIPSFTKYVQELLSCLRKEKNRSIGVLGPIGVGKTSVMKGLNNQLEEGSLTLPNGRFEVVIWIDYPEQLDAEDKTIESIKRKKDKTIEIMQDEIMGRLKLTKVKDNSIKQNADIISTALMQKNYILLIDQVSSDFDFNGVGIHKHHKFGKVVIASSSNRVIKQMTEDHVSIQPLSDKDSLDLLQKVCGKIYDQRIKLIAESIVASCGGLPQVIKLVAEHLKDEGDIHVWNDAKQILQSGVESTGFSKLGGIGNAYKLVYNNLGERCMKCLLFVALFPSGHKIYKDYLVECWKAERFLELNIPEIRRARDRGATVLKELTDQYLLENHSNMHIKMPVHFRTFALAQKYPGEENCDFWAPQKDSVLDAATWRKSKRMSLIGLTTNLPERPQSNTMSTLLLQQNPHMVTLGDPFFLKMKKLLILDLNQAGITALPSSISSLINLKCLYLNDCSVLGELPSEVKKLEKLEILDIRGTSIRRLPEEIGDMSQMRCLRISFAQTGCNRNRRGEAVKMMIPPNMISRLQQLEELIIEAGCCCEGWKAIANRLIDELTCLGKLNTLSFHFPTANGLKKFVRGSTSLANKSTHWEANTFRSFKISVGCCDMQHPYGADMSGVSGERHLQVSNNEDISSIGEVLRQASSFELVGHSNVESLSDFNLENTGALKVCILEKCEKLSSVVDSSGKTDCDVLQCLEKLHLFNLQLLECIWKGSVFPGSLANVKVLTVFDCPRLTELLSPDLAKALSSLEHLRVEKCSEIRDIVNIQTPVIQEMSEPVYVSNIFHKVKIIELKNLPVLQSICENTFLTWKSLRDIEIKSCENLKNLGLALSEGLQTIKCEATWWEALELSAEKKQHFLPRRKIIVLEHPLVNGGALSNSNNKIPADPQSSGSSSEIRAEGP